MIRRSRSSGSQIRRRRPRFTHARTVSRCSKTRKHCSTRRSQTASSSPGRTSRICRSRSPARRGKFPRSSRSRSPTRAQTANATRGYGVEDACAAVLTFANGALGTLILADSTATPWNWEATARDSAIAPNEIENCFYVAGTKGGLAIPQLQHWSYDKTDGAWADPLTRRTLPVKHADPYPRQLHHFARVIRGEEKPVIDAAEGARTLAATLAIAESARTGRPVEVSALLAH